MAARTRSFLGVLAVLSATIVLAVPAAHAQSCEAPPGTAGVEQYCESVPDARGEGGAPGRGPDVPAASRRALERAGADGRAVLGLVGDRSAPRRTASLPPRERIEKSDGFLPALGSSIESGSRVGEALVLTMVGLALLLGGWAWMRYRSAPARRIQEDDGT